MLTKRITPITHLFADDGRIPNNPKLPLILYRGGIARAGSPDPELLIEKTFAGNGWGDMWRNGIYPYAHYHSMIHEAMGIARGRAKVRFGGENGEEIEIAPGDVAVVHVLVAIVHIDRMRAVPEREPARAHARHSASSGPFGPNAGSVAGSGTLRMAATALACSALVRQRLYLPPGG